MWAVFGCCRFFRVVRVPTSSLLARAALIPQSTVAKGLVPFGSPQGEVRYDHIYDVPTGTVEAPANDMTEDLISRAAHLRDEIMTSGAFDGTVADLLARIGEPDVTLEGRTRVERALAEQNLQTKPMITAARIHRDSHVRVLAADRRLSVSRPHVESDGTRQSDAGALGSVPEVLTGTRSGPQANPVGLLISLAGSAILVVSVFLRYANVTGFFFGGVEHNTLLLSGEDVGAGAFVLVAAVVVCADVAWIYFTRRPRKAEVFLAFPVVALGLLVYTMATKSEFRFYPIGANGKPNASMPAVIGSPGIAFYVAIVGAIVAGVGVIVSRRSSVWSTRSTKQCPDCAEGVLQDARVCKHCGYRFPETEPPAQSGPSGSSFGRARA